jgi:putative membrane protein
MKKTIFVYIFNLFLVIFLLAACEPGTNNTSEAVEDIEVDQDTVLVEEGDEEVAATDVDLILLAFMNNRMQYMMGEIAREQASSEAVRDFAESIVTRDDETRWKLEDIAQATNADLPEMVGAKQRVKVDSISELPAEQFDQAYMEEVVFQYKENIDRLNELIDEADNPMIEGIAAEIIDIQQAHMERAAAVLEEIS